MTGAPGMLGDGAVTELKVESSLIGQQLLVAGQPPQFRDLTYQIVRSIAESAGQLSGVPVDIAYDDLTNLGGLPNEVTSFSHGSALPGNGKGLVRRIGMTTLSTNEPS